MAAAPAHRSMSVGSGGIYIRGGDGHMGCEEMGGQNGAMHRQATVHTTGVLSITYGLAG